MIALSEGDSITKTTTKIHLLGKITAKLSKLPAQKKSSTLQKPGFQTLVKEIKQSFKSDPSMNDFKRNSVLYSLLQVKYRDEEILESACEAFALNAKTNVQSLTNLLYILAKFKYVPKTKLD